VEGHEINVLEGMLKNIKKKFKFKLFLFLLAFIMYAFFGMSFVVGKRPSNMEDLFFDRDSDALSRSDPFFVQFLVNRKRVVPIRGFWPEILLLSLFNIYFYQCFRIFGLCSIFLAIKHALSTASLLF